MTGDPWKFLKTPTKVHLETSGKDRKPQAGCTGVDIGMMEDNLLMHLVIYNLNWFIVYGTCLYRYGYTGVTLGDPRSG